MEDWLTELEAVAESLADKATRLMARAGEHDHKTGFIRLASEWMTEEENRLRQIIAGMREEM